MTGLNRSAYTIGGGGLALVMSAFLPWVSAFGVFNARPSGIEILIILALGAGLMFLASLVHRQKATSAVRAALWILSVVESLVVFGFMAVLKAANSGGFITHVVQPAGGFYMALIGLVISIVGTIMLQIASSKAATNTAGTPAAFAGYQRSPDGSAWWDGSAWRPMSDWNAESQRFPGA